MNADKKQKQSYPITCGFTLRNPAYSVVNAFDPSLEKGLT